MALIKNSALEALQRSYYTSSKQTNKKQGSLLSPATKYNVYDEDDEEKKKKNKNTFLDDVGNFFEGVGYLGHKAGLGFLDTIEGTVDWFTSTYAKLFLSDEKAERILENDWVDYDAADDWYNPTGGWKTAGDVAFGVGGIVPTVAAYAIPYAGAVVGTAVSFSSAAGRSAKEAYKESGEYGWDEFAYSTGMGAVEAITEMVIGKASTWAKSLAPTLGVTIGKGVSKSAGKVASKAAEKATATTLKSVLKKSASEFASEGMEEMLTEFVTPYMKRATYDPNAKNATADEILYAGLIGGLTGVVAGGGVTAINQASNLVNGSRIANAGGESKVMTLAQKLMDVGSKNSYTDAIRTVYDKLSPAVNSGEKLNASQRRALGELQTLETRAVFEPVVARSAIGVLNSADAVASRLNSEGVYKIVDGKIENVKDPSFDVKDAEVRDITAEDITRGIKMTNKNQMDTKSVTNALKNNDVLRFVAASDAAGRLMMSASESERAAYFGSNIKSEEELKTFVSESSPQEKTALANELGIANLDTVSFEEFNTKAREYKESGKAEQFQERIQTAEQLQRLSVEKAEKLPKKIRLEDGEMKRYSDGATNIAVARRGDAYIVHDFTNGETSNLLTKEKVDELLDKAEQTKKAKTEEAKAAASFVEQGENIPASEANAQMLSQTEIPTEASADSAISAPGTALQTDAKGRESAVNPAIREAKDLSSVRTEEKTDAESAPKDEARVEKSEAESEKERRSASEIAEERNAKNIAREKIPDFDKMDDAKKKKTVSVLKNAVKKGVSAEDATMYARVSARSGLDIVFDKEACLRKVNGEEVYAAGFYDPENNRIVINPDAKKKHASLLIHELSHAIRSYVGKDNKIHYISDKNAKISDELWEKVKKHYSDQNVDVTRMELMLDEASAYYAEEILGTDAAIDLLLGKKKTLKEKILSFFKGAARDYAGDAALSKEARKFLRSFKKMFDAFAEKNQSVEKKINPSDEISSKKSSSDTETRRYSMDEEPKLPRTAGTMSVGQYKQRVADLTKTKSYMKNQVYDIVKKLPMADMASEKTRMQVTEAAWQIFNEQQTAGERQKAVHDISQFLVAKLMTEAKVDNPAAQEANEEIAYLRTGIGNLAFSPEDMKEIQHNVDNDGLRRILGRWGFKGKKNADGTLQGVRTPMEVFVTDIAREMPEMAHLENMHPVEAFLEIDALYTRVKETAAEKKISAFSYMSDEDIESLTKSIEECITEAYSQGGGKSVFMKRVEQGVSYYEERAAKYKEEFNEIKGLDKINGLLMNQAQKMKDLKLGRFANITEGLSETLKNVISAFASIQWRGNISDTNAKKAIKDLYAWYTSSEVKENLFCVTKDDDGLWQQSVAEMMEELAKDESKGFSKTERYALLDVLTYFTHFVENFGKVWYNGEWSDAKELATNFIQVAQNQSAVKHNLSKDLARKYLKNFGDPATVVRMMDQYQDGFFTEIFEKLRDSAISARSAELDILSEYNEFLKKNKRYVQNASEQTIKYRGVDIPKMHLISLYMTMKRKHAYAGVTINGFQFKNSNGDIVRIRGSLDPDAVYSEQEIESYIRKERGEIEKLLTDTDKQYISILEKGYNVDAKRLKADRDIQRFGMTNATSDYYYPLRRANRAQKMDSDVATEIDRVSSASFNKDTVKGAKQELFIESADALFNRHVHAVCQYAYLTPVLDMQKVLYNKDISGNPNHPVSIRTETQNIWPEGFQYFRDMLSDVQGIQRSSSSKFLSSVRGNYAKFQLGANPKTWFTQLSSFLAATSVLDASSVLRGIGMSGKGFDRYSKLARIRVADNAAANAQGVLDNKAKRATNAVGDALMAPIGMMDKFVVSKLFGACQVQIQKDGGAKIGTEENKIEAGKLLTRVILESQQNSIETERSVAMRSGNEFYRTLTMFRSDSMKTIGRVIDGFGEVSALRRILKSKEMSADTRTEMQARLKRAKKKTAKASVALISSSVFMALLAQAFRWIYAKEKEEDEALAETLIRDSLGNMIGGLPVFADVYSSIVDGYDVENYSYSAINDVLGSAKSLINMVGNTFDGGVTAQERNRAIRDASYSLGQLLGIPTRNVYNVFAGLTKRVSKKAGYAIDNAFYEKNYKNDLEKAFENGDDDMTVYIMGLLLGERLDQSMSDDVFSEMLALSKRGYKVLPRTIPSSVTVKDENGDDVEYVLTSDEQDALRLSYSEYTEGLSRLFANAEYSRLSDEDKEAAIDYVSKLYYNMALKNVLGIERGGNSLLWSGVLGVDTFTTYRLTVNNITPDVDRQGNEIAGSKRKKTIQAINSLGTSAQEKLLMICASGYAIKDGDIRGYSADRAKQTLYRYIKAMNVSEEERIKLAEACGFKVKNGRILIN